MKSFDQKELMYIFYSNYTANVDYSAINLIALALTEKVLAIKKISIGSKNDYNNFIEITNNLKHKIDFGGGRQEPGHLVLKNIAANFLKQSAIDCIFEYNLAGRYIDVVAKDLSIIIECGNTDPDKIFEYSQELPEAKIYILPYPDCESDDVYLYEFIATKKILKLIKSINETRNNSIKQAMANSALKRQN